MDKTTKTKIILFASLGIFVLVVLAVVLALGGSDEKEDLQSADTSLRAQQQSDFTLDDMMQSQTGKPEYESFTDEVYRERAQGIYTEDPEVLALQQQLRENQRADSLAAAKPKTRTVKKNPVQPKRQEPEKPKPESRFFSGDKEKNTGNTIEAMVSGDQKITSGSVIKLVTLQEMQTPGGLVLGKGTALFGLVKLEKDRINISIESVRVGNSIYELKKTVYDRDGLPRYLCAAEHQGRGGQGSCRRGGGRPEYGRLWHGRAEYGSKCCEQRRKERVPQEEQPDCRNGQVKL